MTSGVTCSGGRICKNNKKTRCNGDQMMSHIRKFHKKAKTLLSSKACSNKVRLWSALEQEASLAPRFFWEWDQAPSHHSLLASDLVFTVNSRSNLVMPRLNLQSSSAPIHNDAGKTLAPGERSNYIFCDDFSRTILGSPLLEGRFCISSSEIAPPNSNIVHDGFMKIPR